MTTYETISDAELCSLLNQGDKEAFKFLYNRYGKGLFTFASRYINSTEDCKEIVQETFLTIWALHSSLKIDSFQNFLLTAVRNRVYNYYKHKQVKKAYAEHYRIFSNVFETIDDKVIDREVILARIRQRIAQLPERQRQAFCMRLDENMSNGDIAERMKVSKKTIEKYIFEALSQLKAVVPAVSK